MPEDIVIPLELRFSVEESGGLTRRNISVVSAGVRVGLVRSMSYGYRIPASPAAGASASTSLDGQFDALLDTEWFRGVQLLLDRACVPSREEG